jgi:hypothetical protein
MSDDKFRRPDDAASMLADLRSGKKSAEPPPLEVEEVDDSPDESFSMRSADRQQKVMLELRLKTDDAEAFPYSYLVRARFNPSKGIRLDFGVAEVLVLGRNLRPIFLGLVAQRVAVIQEIDDLHAEATLAKDATVVTKIEVKEPKQ